MAKNEERLMDSFDVANAAALAELLGDPSTSEKVRLQIISEILESSKNDSFFNKLFDENMSFAKCPFCSHKSHWLIPEDDLNQFGWISYVEDERVPQHTSIDSCNEFAEACSKKKVTI